MNYKLHTHHPSLKPSPLLVVFCGTLCSQTASLEGYLIGGGALTGAGGGGYAITGEEYDTAHSSFK